jgi:hypothetical protein
MYKLYTDKQEVFECNIELEGASMSNAKARVILETSDMNLVFNGTVGNKGTCKVPIKPLRGMLDESTQGNIKLEIIADDVYFQPWDSNFTIESSKKIKVEVKEQKKKIIKPSKTLVVSEVKNYINPAEKVAKILTNKGITLKTILENKGKFIPLLVGYNKKFNSNKNEKVFIKEVVTKLKK